MDHHRHCCPLARKNASRRTFFRRAWNWTKGVLALLLTWRFLPLQSARASSVPPRAGAAILPGWQGSSAVSDVFAVTDIPAPSCSLSAGTPPATGPCADPATAFADKGVDTLVALMAHRGTHLHKTGPTPQGLVGADDVVVIKINNQWGGAGSGSGLGRLSTNTDLLKGVIWQILSHPDGFSGEVVLVDNAQPISDNAWAATPANAEDRDQTYTAVVDAFRSEGYAVSVCDWTALNASTVNGGQIGDSGYPAGEYARGNDTDCYILLDDPAVAASGIYSYPKFTTDGGRRVSMRYGVWDGSSYDSDGLTFINMPVLKKHGMASATICWKNLVGFISCGGWDANRYGDWDEMHDYFWGYTGRTAPDYGLLGRMMAEVRAPDLHVVDAIWVATVNNYSSYDAARVDALIASTDPFAADWYASEYALAPAVLRDQQQSSAARAGIFRSATRVNQRSCEARWNGSYPYMRFSGSDADTPLDVEKQQLNAYSARSGSSFDSETVSIAPVRSLLLDG